MGSWQRNQFLSAYCPLPTAYLLSLFLLMFGIRADHPHDALSSDDLAVLANPPDAARTFMIFFLFHQNRHYDRRIGEYSNLTLLTQA